MFTLPPDDDAPELLWSTRWRGNTLNKVLVDSNGRIYIAGTVYESVPLVVQAPTGNFPFYQAAHHGVMDGYVACFDANTNLVYSTHYGGSSWDHVLDMAMDEGTNRLAIVGLTESRGFGDGQVFSTWLPQYSGGGGYYQTYTTPDGSGGINADGMIAWFSLDLDWLWSSRFGGYSDDHLTSACFAPDGSFYAAGYSGFGQIYGSTDCVAPSLSDPYFPHCNVIGADDQLDYGGLNDHLLVRFNTDHDLLWSRFAGGSGYEFASSSDGTGPGYPLNGPVVAVDETGDLFLAGSTTTGGSTYGNDYVFVGPSAQYYDLQIHNGNVELPQTDRSDVYMMKFDGTTGQVEHGTFYGGRYGIPVNQPGWDINQDVITCMTTRDSRLYIGGTTASTFWFPVIALDGVASSFLQSTPPLNQPVGATDLTHAFIAQLSWVFEPVGVVENGADGQADITAWFNTAGGLSIQLAAPWTGTLPIIDLFDAQGKLVLSEPALRATGTMEVGAPDLAPGFYAGHVRDTPYTFKVAKP